MNPSPNRPVRTGLFLYRSLAKAFPHDFREAFGDELLEVAEEAVEPVWQRHGVLGIVQLLADVLVRVIAERMAELKRDLRYAVRTLAGSPAFTLVVLASLSLGICIATCAYSEMIGFILRNLPGVSRPKELVALQVPTSFPMYERYSALDDLFSSTAAYAAPVPFGISVEGRTERIWGHLVSPTYFSTFDVHPVLGRLFDNAHDRTDQGPTVVLSYRFWQNHLGGDESVIGKTLRINGQPCTVLGIGPKEFLGASPAMFSADVWMPLSAGKAVAPELANNALERPDIEMFQMVARLKPGVTLARAEAELTAVAQQFEQSFGKINRGQKGRRIVLVTGGTFFPLRPQDMPFFTEFFLIMAGLVLLVACANVANLSLARATERRREIAVRLALGASRGRLIRQLLTENTLLAAAAGMLGFLLSVWLMHLASKMQMPFPMPVSYDFRPDIGALCFTLGVSVLAGLTFGLVPALQATRNDLTPALKEGGMPVRRRRGRLTPQTVLLLAQVAGSLMLLLMIGVLALGIQSTLGIQKGFDPKNLYLISIDPVRDGYSGEWAANFFPKLLERMQRLPSVSSASLTDTVPVAVNGSPWLWSSSQTTTGAKVKRSSLKYVVGKDYFETTGIPILAGRGFRKLDESDTSSAVIVSETLVRDFWKGETPLGRQIEIGTGNPAPSVGVWPGTFDFHAGPLGNGPRIFEVVGVAGDVTNDLVANKQHPAIYFPLRPADYAEPSLRGITLMLRAAPGSDAIGAARREIAAMQPNITPFNARSMMEQISQFMVPLRSAAWTYGLIGAFGLVLASIGLAGVTAYSVIQRSHEIGVRVALGARKRDVLAMVMRRGLTLVAVGTVIGLMGAWAGIRVLSGLFSTVATVSTSDPLLTLGAPLLLASVAVIACYLPARRSMRIDPTITLREE